MTSTDANSTITTTLYKVLVDGASCHGGSLTWPLPTQNDDGSWTPGEWVSVQGDLVLCENALHLTDHPASWYAERSQCWAAEHRGEVAGELDGAWGSKVGVREARLLRPVEWDQVGVWSEGEHQVMTGTVRASGSATVEASGSVTVRAYDSATVRAYDSVTVRAYDSATVEASGSATVEASGSATVRAYDSVTVRASGRATAISDRWHSPSAQVALSQMAAHVDRRGGKLVLRSAETMTSKTGGAL
jgi:hypothetical protein